MSVFGLHHSTFFINKTSSIEEVDIARANLQDIIKDAQSHNAKFLYNEMLDYMTSSTHINLLSQYNKDAASIAMIVNRPVEVFECCYDQEAIDEVLLDPIIDIYLFATYNKLRRDYYHDLVLSHVAGEMHLTVGSFTMFINFNNTNLPITSLPDVQIYEDFKTFFDLYRWFYSRRDKRKIILADSFCNRISKASNMHDILTSLMRGIYYPEYDTHQGIPASIYDIDAHRDNNQKVRIKYEGNSQDVVLYRVNVVAHNISKFGIKRIGYFIYKSYYIAFCYHEAHCDNMSGFKNKPLEIDGTLYALQIV